MDLLLESGITDQRIPFYVGTPNLTSGWVVYRQRGTNAAATMTTPDIVEDSLVTGLYRLLLDEDTTITVNKTTESLIVIIVHPGAGFQQALRVVLYSNLKADVRKVIGSTIAVGGIAPASPIGI